MANITIDRLLNLVPDNAEQVLTHLQQNPNLATAYDSHGYSLVHASVSYNQQTLLRSLINDFHADINMRDEDNETPLFACESVEIARVVLEDLHADISARNNDDQTAGEKMLEEGELPLVAAYIREFEASGGAGGAAASVAAQTGGANHSATAQAGTMDTGASSSNGVFPPPPLPQGVNINMGTMTQEEEMGAGEPDPEIRRRIEELAARPDFQSEEAQAELRKLVTDALGGFSSESGRDAKRRAE